jgi:hypothetical protein
LLRGANMSDLPARLASIQVAIFDSCRYFNGLCDARPTTHFPLGIDCGDRSNPGGEQ